MNPSVGKRSGHVCNNTSQSTRAREAATRSRAVPQHCRQISWSGHICNNTSQSTQARKAVTISRAVPRHCRRYPLVRPWLQQLMAQYAGKEGSNSVHDNLPAHAADHLAGYGRVGCRMSLKLLQRPMKLACCWFTKLDGAEGATATAAAVSGAPASAAASSQRLRSRSLMPS